ncbi:hypothetical protein MGYG_07724 [Nannizzia gypsea CBS 118893]|uniref:Gamma-glutamylcyclotransferase AIG2-like domain-containing protein n=1 Tax=Arthroderma gypseum (strain ATCC MYA-4604 / CBS 118893) TaxID=535722 RepID=E4V3Z2_ARTGP|nr:hypothetical protein MGYG_07724 [Nannizzia gypsea CBS 118893]EFR04716.1 hypothetical protein MGYG_07724 [Nannizzia gypsea CBS 118893]
MPMKACQSQHGRFSYLSRLISASANILLPPYPHNAANKILDYCLKKTTQEEESSSKSPSPPQTLSHLTWAMNRTLNAKRLVALDHYPREYRRALRNAVSQEQLTAYCKKTIPLFVFGPLMLPSFLKSMTDADAHLDQAQHMTQASLLGHKLYLFEGSELPLVMPSSDSGDYVDGMLVFNLSTERRGWIHELEASNEVELRNLRVEIVLEDGNLTALDAAAFVWTRREDIGIIPAPSTQWRIDEFLASPWYKKTTTGYESC